MWPGFGAGFGTSCCLDNTSRIHWFARIIYGRTVGLHVERTGLHHGSYWLNGHHHDAGQRRTRFPHEQRQRHEHADCARWRPADSCDATMRSSASMIAQTVVFGRVAGPNRSRPSFVALALGLLIGPAACTGSPTTVALQPDFAIKTSAGNARGGRRETPAGLTGQGVARMGTAG